jgi:hypothetical protein
LTSCLRRRLEALPVEPAAPGPLLAGEPVSELAALLSLCAAAAGRRPEEDTPGNQVAGSSADLQSSSVTQPERWRI